MWDFLFKNDELQDDESRELSQVHNSEHRALCDCPGALNYFFLNMFTLVWPFSAKEVKGKTIS